MPSGAKKRKAAKRKKEQQAHNHPVESNYGILINGNNPHDGQGNGDKKAEEWRSSDSSEVNSPASDGNPHHTFGERNGSSLNEPVSGENKLAVAEGVAGEEAARSNNGVQQNNTVEMKDDLKPAQDVKNQDATVESSSRVAESEMGATQIGNPEVIDMDESGLKENEVKSLPTSYLANELLVPLDSGKNDNFFPTHDQDVEGVVFSTIVNADKTFTPSGVNQNGQSPESPENQPLVASAPRLAQRTSWLSCCGLFSD